MTNPNPTPSVPPAATLGGPAAPAAPAAPTAPRPAPAPAALQPAATGVQWYDPAKMYSGELQSSMNQLSDSIGMTAADRDRAYAAHSAFFEDAGISPREAGSLHSLLASHVATPADDATARQWATEARRHLREQYGPEAETRLAKVEAFVRSRPEFAQLLKATGLQSHPRLIASLAERAHSLRAPKSTTRAPGRDVAPFAGVARSAPRR